MMNDDDSYGNYNDEDDYNNYNDYEDYDDYENYNDYDDCNKYEHYDSVDTISICVGDKEGAERLVRTLHGNTNLKLALECTGRGVDDYDEQSVESVKVAIQNAPLTHLRLAFRELYQMDTFFANIILQAVWNSATIKDLEIRISGLIGITEVAHNILRLERLRLIHQLNHFDVGLLCDGLQQTNTLKTLELYDSCLCSEDFTALSQALTNNRSVTTLEIDDGEVTDDDVKAFVHHWHYDSQIHTLSMRNNKIKSTGALLLIQAASSHPAMENLSLRENLQIGFEGLANIAMALPNIVLKQLDISSCSCMSPSDDEDDYDDSDAYYNRYSDVVEACKVVSILFKQGMKANTTLVKLDMSEEIVCPGFLEMLDFCTLRNKYNPLMSLSEDKQLPLSVWCYIFAKQSQSPSLIFYFLQEQPMLWQRTP